MTIQGQLRDMGIAELIQFNCQEGRTARIRLERDGEIAVLYIQEGQLVHAEMAELQGEPVIDALLSWGDGTFLSEPNVSSPMRSIERSYTSLLLESAQRLDQSEELGLDGGEMISGLWSPSGEESGLAGSGSMTEMLWSLRMVEGVRGVVVVAHDGIVIGHNLEGNPEKEGAVAAFVTASAKQVGETLGLGSFQRASVTIGKKATPVLVIARPNYSIGVLLGEQTSPSLVASRIEALIG